MDKFLTREELGCLREVTLLIHPIYSEARRYLPVVSNLLQQELQVLRERKILRVEEIYGESFLTKKTDMSLKYLMKKYLGSSL